MNTVERGRAGEDMALNFLEHNGHSKVARNFRSRVGEIDLITENNGCLHFVEVKNWLKDESDLEYSVNSYKISRIYRTAQFFLLKEHKYSQYKKQFDLVLVNRTNKSLQYIPQAFEGGEK